jgi:hypothetical protein
MGGEQVAVKTALASRNLTKGQGIQRRTSPANHRIPHLLDVFAVEKIRRELGGDGLAFCAVLMGWAETLVDVAAVGAVGMVAVNAAEGVYGLAGEGAGRKAGSGDYLLSVKVSIPGDGCLSVTHRSTIRHGW